MKSWICTCGFKNALDEDCPNCGKKHPEGKRSAGIARRSVKETARMKTYNQRRPVFLRGKFCVVFPKLKATEIHHARGRGKFLLDDGFWIPVSREGHDWIHNHPVEAFKKGWKVSRSN